MKLTRTFERWLLGDKLKIGVYDASNGEVFSVRRPSRRVRLEDVSTWRQVFLSIGVWVIQIQTTDGKVVEWDDRYGYLIELLHKLAAGKELPFTCA